MSQPPIPEQKKDSTPPTEPPKTEPPKTEPPKTPPKSAETIALEEVLTDLIKSIPDWKEEDYADFSLPQKVKIARKLLPRQNTVPAQNPAVPPAPSEDKIETLMERNKRGGEWYKKMIEKRDGLRLKLTED